MLVWHLTQDKRQLENCDSRQLPVSYTKAWLKIERKSLKQDSKSPHGLSKCKRIQKRVVEVKTKKWEMLLFAGFMVVS